MMLAEEMALAETISDEWQARLQDELADHSSATRDSIVRWLIGADSSRLNGLDAMQRQIVEQAMDYRYRILRQRYLGMSPEKAYKGLIQRLSNLFLIRNKIRTWIALSAIASGRSLMSWKK